MLGARLRVVRISGGDCASIPGSGGRARWIPAETEMMTIAAVAQRGAYRCQRRGCPRFGSAFTSCRARATASSGTGSKTTVSRCRPATRPSRGRHRSPPGATPAARVPPARACRRRRPRSAPRPDRRPSGPGGRCRPAQQGGQIVDGHLCLDQVSTRADMAGPQLLHGHVTTLCARRRLGFHDLRERLERRLDLPVGAKRVGQPVNRAISSSVRFCW